MLVRKEGQVSACCYGRKDRLLRVGTEGRTGYCMLVRKEGQVTACWYGTKDTKSIMLHGHL